MASSLLRSATRASQKVPFISRHIVRVIVARDFSSRNQYQLPNWDSKSRYQLPNRDAKKLRTHAVNIFDGDYEDDSDGEEDAFESDSEEERSNMSKADRQMLEDAKREDDLYEQRKKRWMELTKPVVRVSKIDERGRSYGRGSRKTAHARVWIQPGMGEVVVNRRPFEDYFPRDWHREQILLPMVATETCGDFDIQCHVEGGGLSGKAGAIRHGLARALQNYNPNYRPPLKRLGLLTRDPRKVERKKIGKIKARKSPTWVRR